MSEPQHPDTEGTQTNIGQSGPPSAARNAAPQPGGPARPASFESLAAAGARLAQLREAKGWSVDDVSARLKVPPPKMRALEAGDISHLPGTTFALGVVRSYAKMLGVDAAPFVSALRREKGEPEPDLSMPASTGTDLPRGRVSVSLGGAPRHRSWWWGAAAVVVGLIALVMWHSGGGESPAWLARLKASANGAAANSSGTSTTVSGQAGASGAAAGVEEGAVTANPPALAASGEQGAAAMASSSVLANAPASAVQQPVQPAQTGPAAIEPLAAANTPAPAAVASSAAPAAVAAGSATIGLKVMQDSWFSVRDKSGKEVFSGIVHPGETKEIAGEQPFKVVAGNRAGLQSVTLDGKAVDVAKYSAAKGNVSRFSLP
ncbi:DUF4115 domain-containing protein [Trinickia sp. LjRoot230]|uniref:helix-turn-helix domain-containing protein n=1 Tax=Trinickia sp. LjRoot230 TaxID=3342288 RepID=UPI003ECFE584